MKTYKIATCWLITSIALSSCGTGLPPSSSVPVSSSGQSSSQASSSTWSSRILGEWLDVGFIRYSDGTVYTNLLSNDSTIVFKASGKYDELDYSNGICILTNADFAGYLLRESSNLLVLYHPVVTDTSTGFSNIFITSNYYFLDTNSASMMQVTDNVKTRSYLVYSNIVTDFLATFHNAGTGTAVRGFEWVKR